MNIFNLVKGRDMYIYILIRACTNTCVYIYSILYDMISLIVYVYVYMYTCTQSCVKFDGVFFFVISRAFLENYDRSSSRSPPPHPPFLPAQIPPAIPGLNQYHWDLWLTIQEECDAAENPKVISWRVVLSLRAIRIKSRPRYFAMIVITAGEGPLAACSAHPMERRSVLFLGFTFITFKLD